jgi:hypothetical protein
MGLEIVIGESALGFVVGMRHGVHNDRYLDYAGEYLGILEKLAQQLEMLNNHWQDDVSADRQIVDLRADAEQQVKKYDRYSYAIPTAITGVSLFINSFFDNGLPSNLGASVGAGLGYYTGQKIGRAVSKIMRHRRSYTSRDVIECERIIEDYLKLNTESERHKRLKNLAEFAHFVQDTIKREKNPAMWDNYIDSIVQKVRRQKKYDDIDNFLHLGKKQMSQLVIAPKRTQDANILILHEGQLHYSPIALRNYQKIVDLETGKHSEIVQAEAIEGERLIQWNNSIAGLVDIVDYFKQEKTFILYNSPGTKELEKKRFEAALFFSEIYSQKISAEPEIRGFDFSNN